MDTAEVKDLVRTRAGGIATGAVTDGAAPPAACGIETCVASATIAARTPREGEAVPQAATPCCAPTGCCA